MQTFNVPRLTNKTPAADQAKLVEALKAIDGVESVTLQVASSSFTIKGASMTSPSRDAVAKAASKQGFEVKPAGSSAQPKK